MVVMIESLIGILLFTILIVPLTLKNPLISVGDYPPAIREKCIELGLIEKRGTTLYAASHKEVKRNLAGTGVLNHAGSDSFRDSLPIFKGMRICPT